MIAYENAAKLPSLNEVAVLVARGKEKWVGKEGEQEEEDDHEVVIELGRMAELLSAGKVKGSVREEQTVNTIQHNVYFLPNADTPVTVEGKTEPWTVQYQKLVEL